MPQEAHYHPPPPDQHEMRRREHDAVPPKHSHHDHAAMVADFRRRFWVSLVLTLPILALSPMIQAWQGLEERLAFPGSPYVLFGLSSAVYFYGGWPFLNGLLANSGSVSRA
jgi:cation transport ATPase